MSAGSTASSRVLCLRTLRDHGEATVTDVAARVGLARPTVEATLTRLAADGLVEPSSEPARDPRAGSGPGRGPSTAFRFRPEHGFVAGVDLLGPRIRVVLRDLGGRRVDLLLTDPTLRSPSAERPDPRVVGAAVDRAVVRAGLDRSRLRAVGVGAAGIVHRDGTVLTSPFVPSWVGLNLPNRLFASLAVPVTVDNDLSLAALAEAEFGAMHGTSVAVYLLVYHRVSARITVEGRVLRGRRNRAGELGPLQSLSGADGTEGHFADVVADVAADLARLELDPQDAPGRAALARLVAAMTPAVAALVLAVDPDVVVLGGPLGRYARMIATELTLAVNAYALGDLDVVVTGNSLGADAVGIGASQRAFSTFAAAAYLTPGMPPPPYAASLSAAPLLPDPSTDGDGDEPPDSPAGQGR